jgi:Reverse transcriptase (RNA-dependent DNA polymerase)
LDTPAPGQGGVMDAAAPPRAKKQKISITQTLKTKLVTFEHICLPLKSTAIVPFRDAHTYPLPKSVKEALSGPFAYEWLKALLDELQSLLENGTWELVPRRPGMKVIPCHWVFTIKSDADGNPVRFKCRLVAGGNHQEYGIDYLETFAPVSRQATMKTFLALAARNGWEVHQIDIKTAFLNGPVDTDVFMMQPPGFVEGFNLVCHLLKCLYGLKQAPRQWYEMLKAALRDLGFEPQLCDTSFWVNRRYKCIIYLTSVVDDMLVASAIPAYTLHVIKQILSRFKGTHGGIAHHYCGMKLTWQQGAVKLSQQAYVEKVLSMFTSLTKVNPRTTPMDPDIRIVPEGIAKGKQHFESPLLDVTTYPYRTLIGAMNYLACCTRPDIAYTVNQLAKVNNAPTVAHWKAAIHCLGYLQATKHLGIVLGHSDTPAIAYVDSSYGTGTPDLKPVAGHVLLVHGGPVTWASKTQQLTSTSSTEAEYRALSDSVKDVLWLSQILSCFSVVPRPFPMKSDNMGAIKAAKNHTTTKHTKHIELHVQFIRERVQRMEVDITHIPGIDNPADLFTKPLPRCKLEVFRSRMGVQ